MNLLNLVIKSFRHYFPAHMTVAIGIAISTAIITGGLIVGDSVSHSLMETARFRTGRITHQVRAGDRIFTRDLAERMSADPDIHAVPAMRLEGIASSEGGQKRLNRVQIWGLEVGFNQLAGPVPQLSSLSPGECIISENTASRLGLKEGDQFLLRIKKASMIPANAPFVSEEVQTLSARVSLKAIAGREEMGRLNMRASQTAPYNVFLSLDWLSELMDMKGFCNMVLISGENINSKKLEESVQDNWTATDAALDISRIADQDSWKISTKRVFIDAATASHIISEIPGAEPVLTYFANSISTSERSTPYSFISSLADGQLKEDEIIINDWLAADLGAGAGDVLKVKYFLIGPLRKLTEKEKQFVVKQVVPISGRFADRELAPFIPGLSDAGSCSEWEAGVPVDLELIRDKDEDYWNTFRGTPKAFISLAAAEQLWKNRFGNYTSFRFPGHPDPAFQKEIEKSLMASLNPADLGFEVVAVREEAEFAASNGVDFSQLFLGLSFFILLSGIILTVLLLKDNLMQRSSQTGTLSALGIPPKTIRRMIMMENGLVAIVGAILGSFLAILYTRLVFAGLNQVWHDIVRTQVLEVLVKPSTLASGMGISLVMAFITLYITARRMLKRKAANVQKKLASISGNKFNLARWIIASFLLLFSLIIVLMQILGGQALDPGKFFLAGGLLLLSLLLYTDIVLRRKSGSLQPGISVNTLINRNMAYNKSRSMTIIILLALGTFLVISTGANRKDLFSGAMEKSSGTGGFLFFAESTLPVLSDLNNPDTRNEQGLVEEYSLLQFRVNEGDDASCLNLNRISNPRIIASDPTGLKGRFSIVASSDYLDPADPWTSLEKEIPGVVPAIADQTVIQWGLGMKVGDTLSYVDEKGEPLKLLLVGGLAPSIFQGNVIISEEQFLRHFPSSSGSNIFLADAQPKDAEAITEELTSTFRDYGWEMDLAAQRLAEFNSVSNTYLSIFLIMGTFGLILGTIGLAIVLVRNIRERRSEIALMTATGFSQVKIIRILTGEYNRLLLTGTLGGLLTSVIATLPSFISSHTGVSFNLIGLLTAAIILNGLAWIWLLSRYQIHRQKIIEDLRNE